jgi:hypothetical protein
VLCQFVVLDGCNLMSRLLRHRCFAALPMEYDRNGKSLFWPRSFSMKTLIIAVALFVFVAANGVLTGAYAQAPSGGGAAPAANVPAVAPTSPTSPTAAPAKSTTHKSTRKSSKKRTKPKSTKSSATKKSSKPSTQGSLRTVPAAIDAG